MRKNFLVILCAMIMVVTGCQKAPEKSIVKNKDMDKMIEQAQETGDANPQEMAEKYDTYKTQVVNEKMGVSVKVDASVDIPKAEKMSVYRVSQNKFNNEFVQKVKKELFKNETTFDGMVLSQKTKSDYLDEINTIKSMIENIDSEEDSDNVAKKEYESELDKAKKEYEAAPTKIDWSKYPDRNKLMSVADLYKENKKDYQWDYNLNKNGDTYYAVSDGSDGNYEGLAVKNSEDYGNTLKYYRSKCEYKNIGIYAAGNGSITENMSPTSGLWSPDREFTSNDLRITKIDGSVSDCELYEFENEKLTITEDEATKIVEKFMTDMGLDDYKCESKELYCETPNQESVDNKLGYRKVYYFSYLRNIDEIFVNNENGSKHEEGWSGDEYVKKDWPGESINFCVNDDGIIAFNYYAPVKITDTVVDNSKLKSFDEVKNIFEQMIVTENAQTNVKEEEKIEVDVSKVILRYMRISERDSYDTGLLVPVWDFIGKKGYEWELSNSTNPKDSSIFEEKSVLTINAIDGSVIDKELGY